MKRSLATILALVMVMSALMLVPSISVNAAEKSIDFCEVNGGGKGGFVDGKAQGNLEVVEFEGKQCLKFTPDASSEGSGAPLALEGLSFDKAGADYGTYRYASVEYKYVSKSPKAGKFNIQLCNSNKVFNPGVGVISGTDMKANEWDVAYFDFAAKVDKSLATDKDTHPIKHIQIRPLPNVKIQDYAADDVIYIGKVTFSEENLMPGGVTAEITKPSENVTPSTPSAGTEVKGEQKSIDFREINKGGKSGFVDGKVQGTLEATEYEGKKVIKFVPDAASENAGAAIAIEGNGFQKIGADYGTYRYASVEYKYVSKEPKTGTFNIQLCNSNKVFNPAVGVIFGTEIKANEWDTAYFDFSEKVGKSLAADKDTHPINHIQLRPFGSIKVNQFAAGDEFYIGKVTFSETNLMPGGVTRPLEGNASAADPSAPVVSPETTETPESLGGSTKGASPKVVGPDDVIVDYATLTSGFVDKKEVGTLEKVTVDGRLAYKYTPNPTSANASTTPSFETYGLADKLKVSYEDYNFISVEYFYATDAPMYNGGIAIYFATSKGMLTAGVTTSSAPLKTGEWDVAYISMADAKSKLNPDHGNVHVLNQFHLRPLNTAAKNLNSTDVIYIGKVGFHKENPNPKTEYSVSYTRGVTGATGEDIPSVTQAKNTTITLPECTWELEDYKFLGWSSSADKKTYNPGDVITLMGDNDFTFNALWIEKSDVNNSKGYAYADLFSKIVDGATTCTVRNVTIDGHEAIECTANPENDKPGRVILDAFSLAKHNINLDDYKYITLLYKYDAAPSAAVTTPPHMQFTRNSGMFTPAGPALKRLDDELVIGKVDAVSYEIPDLSGIYTDPEGVHTLKQFHVYPFGNTMDNNQLAATDKVAIVGVIFHKTLPKKITYAPSYLTGYTDGTFGVNKNMKRAEACTVVARLLAGNDAAVPAGEPSFADAKTHWGAKYIAYCESKGLLKSYSGNFLPDQPMTRAEFAELIFNMGIVNATTTGKTFSDVPADHAKYEVITAAANSGLIGGYADGTFLPDRAITRAQVATVINNAYGRKTDPEAIAKEFGDFYKDLAPDHWAFATIIDASVSHVAALDTDTAEFDAWPFYEKRFREITAADYEEGAAKLAEVEVLTAKRIEEIRNTKTEVTVTGTKYYFAEDGNDANDGLSPEKPKKTLAAAEALFLKEGDGVFFKRGDTFRGGFTARYNGVTYSAYGEGAKPVLMASPANFAGADNWEQTEVANVWKLKTPIENDVGLIVFNEGEAWSEKRIKGRPEFKDGGLENLDCDLAMWHDVSAPTGVTGYVYLRSDKGNPGERFSKSIETNPRLHIMKPTGKNITIDNLCFKYTGAHAIGAGNTVGLTVKNCEFGWIGGSWFRTDTLSRYGNAVEVYGSCDGYVVDNCYIYQVYDAGVTHQYTEGGDKEIIMKDIKYTNNVITDTTYSIEYFIHEPNAGVVHLMQNYEITGNILKDSGYGFGDQRPDKNAAKHIKGWNAYNCAENYFIKDNIFCRGKYGLIEVGASMTAWLPKLSGNTYIQNFGLLVGRITGADAKMNGATRYYLATYASDTDIPYFLPEE